MRVRVKLKYNNDTSAVISSSVLPDSINIATTNDIHTSIATGAKGFQLSGTHDDVMCPLDGSFKFFPSKGYTGIITKNISNSQGVFSPAPEIKLLIVSFDLRYLYIVFDNASKEYATLISMTVNGTTHEFSNNKTFLVIDMREYAAPNITWAYDVSIKLLKWSRPHASAKVTYIATTYSDIFLTNTIQEFTCSENALNSQVYVQPGIVEQYADIVLYDRYKHISEEIKRGTVLKASDIDIVSVDDDGKETSLGSYRVDTFDTDASSNTVSITCNDPSVNFDKIYVRDLPVMRRTLHDMLTELFSHAPAYTWRYDQTTFNTRYYCGRIYTPDNWFKAGTLYDLLNKVCTFGMLRIYWSSGVFIVERCY